MLFLHLTMPEEQARNAVLDFDFMYHKYHNMVWARICKAIRDEQLREEIMQDIFVKYYKTMKEFSHENAAVKWLKVVTNSTIIDAYRKTKTYEAHITITSDDDGVFEARSEAPQNEPEEKMLEKEYIETIRQAVWDLKPTHHEIIIMHYYTEKEVKDIAENKGVSKFTIYSQLARAREILYKEIERYNKEGGTDHGKKQ